MQHPLLMHRRWWRCCWPPAPTSTIRRQPREIGHTCCDAITRQFAPRPANNVRWRRSPQNKGNYSPLIIACHWDHPELAADLYKAGADKTLKTYQDLTAHFVAMAKSKEQGGATWPPPTLARLELDEPRPEIVLQPWVPEA